MNYQTAMIQLPLVKESSKEPIVTPEDVWRLCSDLSNLAQESFHVLLLNVKNQLINRHMISLGLVDASMVHAREVMRSAIIESASAIVLVHNHPTGDPTPSAEDIRITKHLIEAGKTVDIKIVDHIIIGRGNKAFLSMREEGLCNLS